MSMDNEDDNKESTSTKEKFPASLFQLFAFLIKNFTKNLPNRFIFALVTGAAALLLHTYLMVVVNEGFRLDSNSKVLQYILVLNNGFAIEQPGDALHVFNTTLFWMIVSVIFWGSIAQIRSFGFKVFFLKVLITITEAFSDIMEKPGSKILSLFLGSICVGIMFGLIIRNPLVSLVLAILLLLTVCYRGTSMLLLTMYLAWCDLQRLFMVNPKRPFYIDIMSMILRGTAFGLIFYGITPFIKYGNIIQYVILLVFVVLLLLNIMKKIKPRAASSLMMLGITFFVSAVKAFADDGGWQESGGTLIGWVQSEGAWEAVKRGVAPFMGAFSMALGYAPSLGKLKKRVFSGIDDLRDKVVSTGDSIITSVKTNVPIITGKVIKTTEEIIDATTKTTAAAWDYVSEEAEEFMDSVKTDTFDSKVDKNSATAYVGNATVGGSYGIASGNVEGYVGDIKTEGKSQFLWDSQDGKPQIVLERAVEASGIDAKAEGEIGGEDFSVFGEAEGKVLTAKASAGIEADIMSGDANVNTELGAAVLEGELAGGFNVFGYKVKLGVSGSALSAQAKVAAGLDDGTVTFEAKAGLGIGGGFKISIGKE